MKPDIFTIENSQLIINEHILAIPELRAVYEAYEDPKPALLFLRHLCDPYGPYNQLPEDQKEEIIFADFPGDYSLEDEVMQAAREKLDSLYLSTTRRFYLANKKLLETLGEFARTTRVQVGRDGNYGSILSQLNNVGKMMAQFRQLEQAAEDELAKYRTRGEQFESYDQSDE